MQEHNDIEKTPKKNNDIEYLNYIEMVIFITIVILMFI